MRDFPPSFLMLILWHILLTMSILLMLYFLTNKKSEEKICWSWKYILYNKKSDMIKGAVRFSLEYTFTNVLVANLLDREK